MNLLCHSITLTQELYEVGTYLIAKFSIGTSEKGQNCQHDLTAVTRGRHGIASKIKRCAAPIR